ncbi:diguanylate cyclase domain-containing protein [Reinekea marinisedimentorum]|uniref:Diguanylate cyclase (GGDEF)-like protein n=1 Tax=Reinekea marinisedimentorum TaxID=230495 RepID=A0A4V2UJ05_9GAMM|nr:diguanylate cyclase [Reinekea marinisedimentorum]TCS38240.1 diguanylate cyclase (GGDEF)-like protein [Reinekea marinisedimentorum]
MKQDTLYTELKEILQQVKENPQKVQLLAERAILLSQKNGWIRTLALANLVLGWCHIELRVNDAAVENFQRANILFKDTRETEFVANGYFGLGSAYILMGEYTLAIEQFRMALQLMSGVESGNDLVVPVRIGLSRGLMNLGYWSDAEQELMTVTDVTTFNDVLLAEYQLLLLRLAFFRGNQRTVQDQLQLCRELVYSIASIPLSRQVEYFSSRYLMKYENVKIGESQLKKLWDGADANTNTDIYFLTYEAAMDLLSSDKPKYGIDWLNLLLDHSIPLALSHQIHISLASFYVTHLCHDRATAHYQHADRIAREMRENEVTHQWARFQAEEVHHSLRHQVAQQKKNNQILAESNALLQAVNRIAMAVNAALDQESMLRRLRDQLNGWIDTDVVGIAELKEDNLYFDCVLEGEKRLPPDRISMTETNAWSVRAVNDGRILIENNYEMNDDMPLADAPNLVRAVSFIPLKCENRVIGVLTLQSRSAHVFNSRAISLLEYMAPVIGIAFANLINLERTRELSGELNKQQQELNDVRQLMAHISDHDELTGLPNRASLPEHFDRWRTMAPFHCLLLRIVNLDELNSAAGYGVDEEIIRVIGQRLRNRIRPDDLLARTGSDQFLLFVESMRPTGRVKEFADQVIQLAIQPLRSKDTTVYADVAMGIVTFPDHGETLDELMSMATIALNYATEDESAYFCIE